MPNWKEFYQKERENLKEEIKKKSEEYWNGENDDHEVSNVIQDNGILSFPHTLTNDSLEPVLRIINGLHKNSKKRVIALGVLHGSNTKETEFSLDCLERVNKIFAKENGLKEIEIVKIFPSQENDRIVERSKQVAKDLENMLEKDTSVIMTGDLCHYGHGYKYAGVEQEILVNCKEIIKKHIKECLDAVYIEKDYDKFLDVSRKALSDQYAPAIIASEFLKGKLEYKIFYNKLSDYSKILKAEKPTIVSSVFYGVYKAK